MTTTIEATYEGSNAVHIEGRRFTSSKGGVIPNAARKLIAEGRSPGTLVQVSREGVQVFSDATLGEWAGISVEEGEHGTRFVPFRERSPKATLQDRRGSPQEARKAA